MVQRHNDLFEGIASFQALNAAAQRAVAGKRRKPGAAAFMANLERELLRLERELLSGTYRTGRYLELVVRDPKRRVVSAAPFRDRVVHHALVGVLGPLFERGFIDQSYANRKGKGTHRAVHCFEHLRDRHAHVLRADIWRYFPAIDHAVLKADLRRRVACPQTLVLCDVIIDGSNAQEPAEWFFPGDDLLSVAQHRRGLPLGNLTSQFFANVYLDGFDHWATEVLQAAYLRYVDDFALFSNQRSQLLEWQAQMEHYLAQRRLRLHPTKTQLLLTKEPQRFLGFDLLAGGGRRLVPANVTRFRARLEGLRRDWARGTVSAHEVQTQVQGWVAHAQHANTHRLRHSLFKGGWFDPSWADGQAVKASVP
jgi:RNA-directed DNA polymerase